MVDREDPFRPEGAKLRVRMTDRGGLEVIGNRAGLKGLAAICNAVSEAVGEPGNHYHLMDSEGFWGTEPGSVSLIIYGEDF